MNDDIVIFVFFNGNWWWIYSIHNLCRKRKQMESKEIIPILLGGIGDKVSNGGTQYYFQDRVYSSESAAVSITTDFRPCYLVIVNGKK